MKTAGIFCVMVSVWATTAFGQQTADSIGELSGLVFSDYYWMAAHHNEEVEGNNGFWIRRAYLTYDRGIGDSFSGRLRLEANSAGDFQSGAKLMPVVKDLYLRWENDRHRVTAGIASTPTFALVEDVWEYRSVEKTPLDVMGFASSRDLGVAISGSLDSEERLRYHAMFGNGNSNRSEVDKGKKVMASLSYAITDQFTLELYGDWNNLPGDRDRITLQGFAAFQSEDFNAGLLFAHQSRKNAVAGSGNLNLELASVFVNFTLSGDTRGYLRVDHAFDAMPGVDGNDYLPINSETEATLLIGGLDFDLGSEVYLLPNVEAVLYAENETTGETPGPDLVPRLTLVYNF